MLKLAARFRKIDFYCGNIQISAAIVYPKQGPSWDILKRFFQHHAA